MTIRQARALLRVWLRWPVMRSAVATPTPSSRVKRSRGVMDAERMLLPCEAFLSCTFNQPGPAEVAGGQHCLHVSPARL